MHHSSPSNLIAYLENQLIFFGYDAKEESEVLRNACGLALKSTIDVVSKYKNVPNTFNILQTHHSAVFLFKLSSILYQEHEHTLLAEKVYLLNRMINGLDLFFKINMPANFLIGHGLGTVFSNASFGDYLVIFQSVTIGVQEGKYPTIGDKVVIYPNSVIVGTTVIGDNSVIGAGVKLINKNVPSNTIVYEKNSKLVYKKNVNQIDKYFHVQQY